MPKSRPRSVRHRPIRRERDRAMTLLSVLALFLIGYVVIASYGSTVQRIDATVVAGLTSFVSIGIAVLVTTFSFVFVALSLVSAQFSPRVVRHFWHGDRFRFVFLWSSILVFGYCFVIQFVESPRLHLLGLVLGSYQIFVMFPVFLGYLADNLNAASITKKIADRTLVEIADSYLEHAEAAKFDEPVGVVVSRSSGFLEKIDSERLLLAFEPLKNEHPELELHISNYLGSFIEIGTSLISLVPPIAIDDSVRSKIASCFSVNKFRSDDQDIEYGVRQLVDIGIKAISPALNDPTTCVNCIHYLGVIVKELAVRDDRSMLARKLGAAGIILKEPTFEQYLDDAFDQIYHFGRRDHVIVRTVIGVLREVVSAVPDVSRAKVVVNEVSDMELGHLIGEASDTQFGLVESRNYVRKSLTGFYRAAAERFELLGESELAFEMSSLSKAYDVNMEVKR